MSKPSNETDLEAGGGKRDIDDVAITTTPSHHHTNRLPSSTHLPTGEIHARRSGSASVLLRNDKGELLIERKNSDIRIALKSRLSQSSLPSILPILSSSTDLHRVTEEPLIDATDALERTGGTSTSGAYKEHLYPLEILAEKFSVHIDTKNISKSQGLTSKKATSLLEEYGPNVLTPPPRLPLWALFLLQFTNLLMVLLQVTALLCIILFIVDPTIWENLYLGVLLYIVVFVTCYETFSQEAKSDNLMEQFRAMVPQQTSVIRDGQLKTFPVSDLVLGDIIRLKAGDKVPADCRVLAVSSMKVDQSMITGEAEPVDIEVEAADPNALEARNLLFNGSLVVDGSCYALVIKTGDATLIGTMVELTGDVGKNSSTLKSDIDRFVKIVTLFALFQAALIFIVGLSRGYDPLMVFIYGFVVIMIGNVPQGLPTTVTASLFLVAERMSKQNVFVKKLDIIETLGACSLICTDKTGTLTMNQMTVSHLWLPCLTNDHNETTTDKLQYFQAEDFSAQLQTSLEKNTVLGEMLMRLLSIATLNSRVVLQQKTDEVTDNDQKIEAANKDVEPTGDATELGLYRFFASILKQLPRLQPEIVKMSDYEAIESYRQQHPKVHEIPFNSSFKWQMSIHHMSSMKANSTMASNSADHVLMLKGAPDVLLDKCGFYFDPSGKIVPIDEAFKNKYQRVYEEFGGQGERVLGFAVRFFDIPYSQLLAKGPQYHDHLRMSLIGDAAKARHNDNNNNNNKPAPMKDLIFVGLITLLDPPRPEVPQAIKDCHKAHVKVVMVTGDHPLTAASIARKIGLLNHPTTKEEVAKLKNIPVSEVQDKDVPSIVVHGSTIPQMTEQDWANLTQKQEIVFARTSPEQKLTIVKEFTKAGYITAMTGDGVNDSPALKQAAIGIAMGLNGSAVAKEAADVVLLDDNFASIVTGIREGRLLFANLKKSIAYSLAHLTPEVFPVLMWGFAGVVQPMGSMLTLCIDLLTELLPATSFVFEDAESMIMESPPRNPLTDKLTSFNLLFYAYGQAGLVITGGCLFYFFRAFQRFGISPLQVMNNNNKFFPADSSSRVIFTSDGKDSYTPSEQDDILQSIQAGWYLMIVIGQVSHLFQCRTAKMSIFTHGLFRNRLANIGAVVAVILACFIVYCPGINMIVSAKYPVSIEVFYASLVVTTAMWVFGEGRKWIIRNFPENAFVKVLVW